FLECAWETLDDGGYDPLRYPGSIGVYGGSNLSTYLLQILARPELAATLRQLEVGLGNANDSLTTRVSYKLNLRGPSVAVQTFCSTSAVAAHMACESLLRGECDMALAGGVRIDVPHRVGYLHEPGGIASPDGHTRTFDVRARGAVLGNGVALVLLKPLAEAQRDGDHVYAVIRGSAVNNDGAGKVGYTAPSVGALAEVVGEALEKAEVDPSTISYVEAHGTATELGDPIELAALTRAFRAHTSEQQFCAIGSVKSNLGHLDRAAGTTGLIKTALALERGVLPPSLHFEEPNPKLELAASPFYVQTACEPWESHGTPRRAAVNALGIGGTNAHFILEEPPAPAAPSASRPWQLLVLSAHTAAALERMTDRLAAYLRSSPADLADVAFTLQQGRRVLSHRRMLLCRDAEEAARWLESRDAEGVRTRFQESEERPVTFLFPDAGQDAVNRTEELYRGEPTFQEAVDRCCRLLEAELGRDLREVILAPREAGRRPAGNGLTRPAVFVVEWALAQLLLEWGLAPQAMLGDGVGEYVAATLAGTLSLADALAVVSRPAPSTEEGSGAESFAEASQELLNDSQRLLVEVGPSLCCRQALLRRLGELWLAGAAVDWQGFCRHQRRRRVPLPAYPFAGERYWIAPQGAVHPRERVIALDELSREPDVGKWFYVPQWRPSPLPAAAAAAEPRGPWWAFVDGPFGERLLGRLEDLGETVCRITAGASFECRGHLCTVDPGRRDHY
ncbi:MAG: type I polyketide synthase, partial [bacterium]|nr:type I polyketide synthase [bacterium]